MKNKFSLLISIVMIFSLLLPNVIPRSYRLQNPDKIPLSTNLNFNSKDSIQSKINHNEIINCFIEIGDSLISYGYTNLKHHKKVKFRLQEENDSAQAFTSLFIGIINSDAMVLYANIQNTLTTYSINVNHTAIINILKLLSRKVE